LFYKELQNNLQKLYSWHAYCIYKSINLLGFYRSNDKKQRLIGAAAFYLEFALQTRLFIALSQPVVCESAAKNFFGSRSFLQKFLWE